MKNLLIAILCISVIACNKKSDPLTPASTTTTVNNFIGSFSGNHFHKYKNTVAAGVYSDSSNKADTFVISKVSADSFMLTKPYWDISTPAFKYNGSNNYTRSEGSPAFNNRLRELSIRFNSAKDSIYVEVHYVTVSSNMLEEWDTFSGKRL